MLKSVIVKKSKIHGKGVFANKNFRKGEIVIKWDLSKKVSKEEYVKLSKKDKEKTDIVGGKYFIMSPPASYVNHSCNPNTYVIKYRDIAKKSISKGEEITTDYSKYLPADVRLKCNCGSKNCKGIIRDS